MDEILLVHYILMKHECIPDKCLDGDGSTSTTTMDTSNLVTVTVSENNYSINF